LRLGVHDLLDDGEQVEGAARGNQSTPARVGFIVTNLGRPAESSPGA
jgi:hypothetical protein